MIKRRMTEMMRLIAMMCLTMISTASAGNIVADSVSGFSDTQGVKGWYYGYSTQVSLGVL